jgi:hypothetical protein
MGQAYRGTARSYLQVVVHAPAPRQVDSRFSSHLSEHPLVIGDPLPDLIVDDEGDSSVESAHKIGGLPYLINNHEPLESDVERILAEGYLHLLQVDFPGGGGDALVSGDWLFGDGMFHLFGRQPFGPADFCWAWEL